MTVTAEREALRGLVTRLVAYDERETADRAHVLDWIDSGSELYRQVPPDHPPQHLVTYFLPHDTARDVLFLIEHRKAGLWPADLSARAHARAISSEIHAGFADLRRAMWMNTRKRFPGKGRTPEALADVARICAIWREAQQRYGAGGPFLYGKTMTMADAMYAPVVCRFVTWEPELPADAKAYVTAVWDHPLLQEWRRGADAETWVLDKYETP